MRKFKIGDTVYYFANTTCQQIFLDAFCIDDGVIQVKNNCMAELDYKITVNLSDCYKTKNEVIDAFIKRLEELKHG